MWSAYGSAASSFASWLLKVGDVGPVPLRGHDGAAAFLELLDRRASNALRVVGVLGDGGQLSAPDPDPGL